MDEMLVNLSLKTELLVNGNKDVSLTFLPQKINI